MRLLTSVAAVVLIAHAIQLFNHSKNSPASQDSQHLHADSLSDPPQRACRLADPEGATQRFAQLLRFQTLADARTEDHRAAGYEDQFTQLLEYLEGAYPFVYKELEVEKVGIAGGSRLYTWKGSDASLKPIMFISHFDVVPVTPGTEKDWVHPPFSGDIADGYIWGRGALDVKYGVAGLLEAISNLLQQGFQPRRTIMLSFGSDEEVTGRAAQLIAEHLADKGVEIEAIVDEGGIILSDGLKGFIDFPVALIGTAEKVYTSVQMELISKGGHSSMPPIDGKDIASQAARVMAEINANPFPAEIRPPISDLLAALAPYLPGKLAPARPLLMNAGSWPLNKLLATLFIRASSELAALVRTTVAVTNITAGVADNVLPNIGKLVFNMRAYPGTPREELVAYLEARMAAAKVEPGARLTVKETSHFGPAPGVSSTSGFGYQLLKQAIQEYWRHEGRAVAVAPNILSGGTDSKHYAHITKNIYRFVPYSVNKTAGDLETIHSTNERVRASDFTLGVCTYARVIELMGSQ